MIEPKQIFARDNGVHVAPLSCITAVWVLIWLGNEWKNLSGVWARNTHLFPTNVFILAAFQICNLQYRSLFMSV